MVNKTRTEELYQFERYPAKPIPFSWQERDGQILEKIHAFDGMLSVGQIARLLFRSKTGTRRAEKRLQILISNRFLRRPNARTRKLYNDVPVFLGERGADFIAGNKGVLRSEIAWRRDPRWSLINHDLMMNDFFLDLMEAVAAMPAVTLEHWLPAGEFWREADQVAYQSASGKKRKRLVKPDGYFSLLIQAPDGREYDSRNLLEIDMGSETHARIGRDKVLSTLAYLGSDPFAARFGKKYGHVLFVTTTEERAQNMCREVLRVVSQTNEKAGKLFFFSWFAALSPETILTGEVWYGGQEGEEPVPLIPRKLLP